MFYACSIHSYICLSIEQLLANCSYWLSAESYTKWEVLNYVKISSLTAFALSCTPKRGKVHPYWWRDHALQIQNPENLNWISPETTSLRTSFHCSGRHHEDFQRRKALNSPTQLWCTPDSTHLGNDSQSDKFTHKPLAIVSTSYYSLQPYRLGIQTTTLISEAMILRRESIATTFLKQYNS